MKFRKIRTTTMRGNPISGMKCTKCNLVMRLDEADKHYCQEKLNDK